MNVEASSCRGPSVLVSILARGLSGGAWVTALGFFAGDVGAVPGEVRVGLDIGGAVTSRSELSPSLGLRGAYGLERNFELQLEATALWLQVDGRPLVTQLVPALSYRIDVVRWVPFLRVGAGPLVEWGAEAKAGALASGAVGADYIWDRSLALSLTYQADFWLLGTRPESPVLPAHRALLGITWSSGW